MKRCKAEYFFKGDSLICKGLPSKDYEDYQRKCLPCTHAFGWIFLCHLERCDSVNFIDKKFLTLYCLITWNEIHALMVIHYCMERLELAGLYCIYAFGMPMKDGNRDYDG